MGPSDQARTAFQQVIDFGEYRLVDNYFDNFKEETENGDEFIFEVQFSDNTTNSVWSTPNTVDFSLQRQEYGFLDWNNVVASEQVVKEFESDDPREDMSFFQMCDTYNNGNNVALPNPDQYPEDDSRFACGFSDSEANNADNVGRGSIPPGGSTRTTTVRINIPAAIPGSARTSFGARRS